MSGPLDHVDAWYTKHLPEPPFYKEGNPLNAVTWFKDTAEVRQLVELLKRYRDDYTVTRSADPGQVVYEDDYQIATV